LWIITIRFVDDHHPFCGSSPSVSWITIRFVDHHHLLITTPFCGSPSVSWITICSLFVNRNGFLCLS
jgi:hypothetical protein